MPQSLSTRNCKSFQAFFVFERSLQNVWGSEESIKKENIIWKPISVLSIALFLSALRCPSLKCPLFLLPRLLSRLSSLKFLKFRRLFSGALFCSLIFIPLLFTDMISRQKNAGCRMQRWRAISCQSKLLEHSRPKRLFCLPTSTPAVCTPGRAYADAITKTSHMERFPKKLTHGSPLPRLARLSSAHILWNSITE